MNTFFGSILRYLIGGLVTGLSAYLIFGTRVSLQDIGIVSALAIVLMIAFDMNCLYRASYESSSSHKG